MRSELARDAPAKSLDLKPRIMNTCKNNRGLLPLPSQFPKAEIEAQNIKNKFEEAVHD
jgi:hypothetical protein